MLAGPPRQSADSSPTRVKCRGIESLARRRIETICGQLRLGPDVAVSAFRYYQSALFRGLTRGRNAMQLSAACIYVAARQLRVNLMLLDLSDAVAINVFQVGRTYVDLKRKLNLSLPEIDPCLFVERFASQLDFENKTAAVATTAMRLLQRMKKDWISTGRRPSGLAAAALLVAARVHEFNRTEEDVAKVARISQETARKRLVEFSRTPSSALSIDAFFSVDYDEEQDPPAFGRQSQTKRAVIDELDMSQVSLEIQELSRRIDQDLKKISEKGKLKLDPSKLNLAKSKGINHLIAKKDGECEAGDNVKELASHESSRKEVKTSRDVLRDVLDGIVEPEILDSCVEDLQMLTHHSGDHLCQLVQVSSNSRDVRDSKLADLKDFPSEASSKLPHFISPVDEGASTADMKGADMKNLPLGSADAKGYALDLTGVDESELDREYLLSPQEVMIKATLWFQDNASFLETQRKRRLEKQKQLEERAKQPRKRKGPRGIYRNKRKLHWTKDEAAIDEETMEERPISKKINYAALEALVGGGGGGPTTSAASPAAATTTAEQVKLPEPSDRPNLLLEAALHDTDILPGPSTPTTDSPLATAITAVGPSAPSATTAIPEQEEEEVVEEEEAEAEEEEEAIEEDEYGEDEEDWQAGEDLW
ncbi:transcription factor TFIIIB subunit brf1 [Sparganum proliferum]